MQFQKIGGLAGLACAATYLFGFVFLITYLMDFGFGTNDIDGAAVVAFIDTNPGLMILWNTVIYILNAIALLVLVIAVARRLSADTPVWADFSRAIGIVWVTLVLGAGMIANVSVEQTVHFMQVDPQRAEELWRVLHAVELGLGGGNEIAGGVWIASVSVAGFLGRGLGKITNTIGVLSGVGGILTVFPALGETAGVVFGLGAILWFIFIGLNLLFSKSQI